MEFAELVRICGDEAVFETGLLLVGDSRAADIRRQLSRWRAAGKIYQLRRGLYCLAPPFQKTVPHPFLAANRVVPGTYVSLQSALAFYGMIPEHVPLTTSVTTRRPGRWETPVGNFEYQHVQVDFFYGFQLIPLGGRQSAFVARPEKALLDLVYLTPGGDSPDYLSELRLSDLGRLDWQVLERFAMQAGKPKLARAAAAIRELALEEEEMQSL